MNVEKEKEIAQRIVDKGVANLGLDADHSSEEASGLNNDNDMISNNPDGEDDDRDYNDSYKGSPLMDK
jgi:hypothetical protein